MEQRGEPVLRHPAAPPHGQTHPRCGAEMRIIAFITEPAVSQKILRHLAAKGLTTDGCGPPASAPRKPTAA